MIDLHPDFSQAHTVSKAYFSIPLDYLEPIGRSQLVRFVAAVHRRARRTNSSTTRTIAKFLEGSRFAPADRAVRTDRAPAEAAPVGPGDSSETFTVIRSFTRLRFAFEVGPIWPWRNAGALMGMLCEQMTDSVSAPLVEVLCTRLRDNAFPIQWFAGLHNGRAIQSEEPDMTAESVDLILAVGLDRLSNEEIAHWLKLGRGPVGDAGKTLVQEPPRMRAVGCDRRQAARTATAADGIGVRGPDG